MDLGISLRQRQEQRLLLLPRMLQAIEILQLSTRDLLAMIERELAENETLELGPPTEPAAPTLPAVRPISYDSEDGDDFVRVASDDDGHDLMAQLPEHGLSLHGHLLAQAALLELTPAVREVVSFLIGSLDGNGHLMLGDDEIPAFFGPGAPVGVALQVLRALEPRGVGQRGPIESMLAQLDPADPDHPLLVAILGQHLDDLAKNRLPKVARELAISLDELKLLLAKIRHLDPCPGRAFTAAEPSVLQPDVVVRREDEEWQVYVDDARVPPLTISTEYETLARDRQAPRRVRDYLQKKLGSARELMAAIAQRRETLGRIARAIVARQRAFLERGPTALRPLKMQEIADAVGVHLSTVSRATSDKYLQTDFGVFPLRDLFDGGKAIGTSETSVGESRVSLKDRIRRLIEGEDKGHPLSDDQLVQLLAEEGLKVARRTIANYRSQLGIPSSWRRRRY